MERCAGRPEVLAISVGNEVPADVARVHGVARIEEGLSTLVSAVHKADPDMLATYCNFPTTEFLEIEGQDLVCFNVFLENQRAFERYLRRLANHFGRPASAPHRDGACRSCSRRRRSGEFFEMAAKGHRRSRMCRRDSVLLDRRVGRRRQRG